MGVILQMTVKLFAYPADMLQPFIEANFVLGLLRDGYHDSTNRSRRHDAANRHHFSVTAAHHIIYDSSQRRLGHACGSVVQANDDLATIILAHCVQDASCDICAHTVQDSHRNISRSGNHLCFLEHMTPFQVTVVACLLPIIIGNAKSHQAIGYEWVANEDGELSHHIHIVLLTVGYQAFAMIRTSVVFERHIAQSELFGSSVCGKTTDYTTDEDEHNGASQHFIVHELDIWSSSYGYYCEGSSSMGIGQAEHQPHTVPALSHCPSHDG